MHPPSRVCQAIDDNAMVDAKAMLNDWGMWQHDDDDHPAMVRVCVRVRPPVCECE